MALDPAQLVPVATPPSIAPVALVLSGPPSWLSWLPNVAMLVAELGVLLYVVVMALSFNNSTALTWVPFALAAFGLHQAASPSAALKT